MCKQSYIFTFQGWRASRGGRPASAWGPLHLDLVAVGAAVLSYLSGVAQGHVLSICVWRRSLLTIKLKLSSIVDLILVKNLKNRLIKGSQALTFFILSSCNKKMFTVQNFYLNVKEWWMFRLPHWLRRRPDLDRSFHHRFPRRSTL